jgi:hypothetical protein
MNMATRYHDNVPDGGKKAALEEAAEWGSLKDGGKTYRKRIAELQAKLPSKPAPKGVVATPAEQQFTYDIQTIQEIEDSTTETEIELLAKATKSALLYLAGRK